jgi:hypothetical protein
MAEQRGEPDWRENHAYTLGVQVYVLRFPYLYLPSAVSGKPTLARYLPPRTRVGVRGLPCGNRRNAARDLQQRTRGNDPAVTDCHGATQGVMRELVVEVRQSHEAVSKASDSIRGVLDGPTPTGRWSPIIS